MEEGQKKDRGMTVSIWLSNKMLDDIDEAAEYASITRSKLIQNLMVVAFEEIDLFQSIGIARLAFASMELRKRWRKALEEAQNIEEGKKSVAHRGVNLSIWVDRSQVEKIEELAEKLKMSRSELIEKLVDFGAAEILAIKRSGLRPVTVTIRDIQDTLKKKWKKMFKEAEKAGREGKLRLDGSTKGS